MKYLALIIVFLPLSSLAQSTETVDLIWEANTYTPSWYQGAALPTSGSQVRAVALPRNANWVYDWQKDGYHISSASGSGANVLVFKAGAPGTANQIRLRIKKGEEKIADQTIAIPVAQPEIHIYEYDEDSAAIKNARSLAGLVNVLGGEAALWAEPFFFSLAEVVNRRLAFDWRVGGQAVRGQTEDNRRLKIVVPAGPAGSGQTPISLEVKNTENLSQTAKTSFSAQVGGGNNFFDF